jgi:uncharacterized protein (TIGR02145 family)
MKRKMISLTLMLLSLVLLINGCKKDEGSSIVKTLEISYIGSHTATLNGEVVSSGTPIGERGFLWSETNQAPGEDENKIIVEGTVGSFNAELTGLDFNTSYKVRAFAINSLETAYGEQKSFNTIAVNEGEVFNPATSKTWMDRNLGASRVATSSTDEEAYGDLYQWGRATDGHEKRNSPITTFLSASDTPGNGSFISMYVYNRNQIQDWRKPQNAELWQGVKGINNPCPEGFRVPTEAEWYAEIQSWKRPSFVGAFTSPLRLPMAGYRYNESGLFYPVGLLGCYWSSTVYQTDSWQLNFNSNSAYMDYGPRANGLSVRCIKN